MFTPRKCGVKFDPPTLVVYYEVKSTGMWQDISVRITCYNSPFSHRTWLDEFFQTEFEVILHYVKLIVLICLVFNKS